MSYLSKRTFRTIHAEAFFSFQPMFAGDPQRNVLRLLQYLINTADLLTTKNTELGTFADDTVIMTIDVVQESANNCALTPPNRGETGRLGSME